MSFSFKAPADWHALTAAALIGSGLGLGLGAAYMAAGLATADRTPAVRASADASVFDAMAADQDPAAPVLAARDFDAAALRQSSQKVRGGRELDCLTEAVYYEARGESPSGQAAVAQVVLNRVRHPAFPKTVCGVVYQGAKGRGCQFSFACNGAMHARRESAAWKRARRVATRALAGGQVSQVGSATHFHTTGVSPSWGPRLMRVSQVGLHIFYKLTPHGPRAAKPAREEAPAVVFASFVPPAPAPDGLPVREMQLSVALLETTPEPAADPAPAQIPAPAPEPAAIKPEPAASPAP